MNHGEYDWRRGAPPELSGPARPNGQGVAVTKNRRTRGTDYEAISEDSVAAAVLRRATNGVEQAR